MDEEVLELHNVLVIGMIANFKLVDSTETPAKWSGPYSSVIDDLESQAFIYAVECHVKGVTVPDSTQLGDPEIANTLLTCSDVSADAPWRAAYVTSLKLRSEFYYLKNIVQTRKLDIPFAERVVPTIIANPYISFIGMRQGCKMSLNDGAFDFKVLNSFWNDLMDYHIKANNSDEACLTGLAETVASEASKIGFLPRVPLLLMRKLMIIEASPIFARLLSFKLQAESYMAYLRHPSLADSILTNKWLLRISLDDFIYLVDAARLALNILILQSCPEESGDLKTKLQQNGIQIRAAAAHMTRLFKANDHRRRLHEDELFSPKFWQAQRLHEDVDGSTLQILNVPYLNPSDFYVDALEENMLTVRDFVATFRHRRGFFGFMANPCIMNPQIKSQLIELDSRQQQDHRGGVWMLPMFLLRPYLVLTVRRHRLLEDALNQLVEAQSSGGVQNLKWPLRVKFLGEEGVDEGGLTKEFFQLLTEQLLNPDYGMFTYSEESRQFWFLKDSLGSLLQFELIGMVFGLAVYNHIILDVHFPMALYKKLLAGLNQFKEHPPAADLTSSYKEVENMVDIFSPQFTPRNDYDRIIRDILMSTQINKFDTKSDFVPCYINDLLIVQHMAATLPEYRPSLDDLDDFLPDISTGLRKLLRLPDQDVESLCLTFSVTVKQFGEVKEVPLKDRMGNPYDLTKPVTAENRAEYVEQLVKYHLSDSIEREFAAFYRGFHRCCGGPALKLLIPQELNLLVCGVPGDLNFQELKQGTKYADGYTADDQTIIWFWEVAEQLSEEDKKALLFFVTGSGKTPVGGLASLGLTISKAGGEKNRLPSAHTCFNHLLLPDYESKEQLERNLRLALHYRHGFGLR